MSLSVKCRIYLAIKMSYCGLRAILDVASSIRSQSSALKPSLPITTLLVIPHKNLKDKREQVAICKAELHQDYICMYIHLSSVYWQISQSETLITFDKPMEVLKYPELQALNKVTMKEMNLFHISPLSF